MQATTAAVQRVVQPTGFKHVVSNSDQMSRTVHTVKESHDVDFSLTKNPQNVGYFVVDYFDKIAMNNSYLPLESLLVRL